MEGLAIPIIRQRLRKFLFFWNCHQFPSSQPRADLHSQSYFFLTFLCVVLLCICCVCIDCLDFFQLAKVLKIQALARGGAGRRLAARVREKRKAQVFRRLRKVSKILTVCCGILMSPNERVASNPRLVPMETRQQLSMSPQVKNMNTLVVL